MARTTTRRGPNPYGFIPFVHVPNLPLANEPWGQSDLVDVIPINREIDERVSDAGGRDPLSRRPADRVSRGDGSRGSGGRAGDGLGHPV